MFVDFRYFVKELSLKGALDIDVRPIFLNSWVDKNSSSCMYTPSQVRTWSILHLNAGCWYLDCASSFCPTDEESIKMSLEKQEVSGMPTGSSANPGNDSDEDDADVFPSGLPEKERLKILARRARQAEKLEKKKTKESSRAVERAQKAADVAFAKAKEAEAKAAALASGSPVMLREGSASVDITVSDSPSNLRFKRDASFAGLSMSRLQLVPSPAQKETAEHSQFVDEFICKASLQSMDAHYSAHGAFPDTWIDLQAFLDKVNITSLLFLVY